MVAWALWPIPARFHSEVLSFDIGFPPLKPLTFRKKYAKFLLEKSCDEDTRSGKIPREEATMVQGFRNTAACDTTSEPQGRNALPGAPVIASMSGPVRGTTRVEPWNTSVSHP